MKAYDYAFCFSSLFPLSHSDSTQSCEETEKALILLTFTTTTQKAHAFCSLFCSAAMKVGQTLGQAKLQARTVQCPSFTMDSVESCVVLTAA